MKKYNKPTLTIEDILVEQAITSSLTANLGTTDTQAGDKSVDYSDFGSGEWN